MAKRKPKPPEQAALPGFAPVPLPPEPKPAKPERTAYGVGRKGRRPILCYACCLPMVVSVIHKNYDEYACATPGCRRCTQPGLGGL